MYPLNTTKPYAFNQWYIAAWRHEVTRELFERKILGESIAFYRQEDGTPVALKNQCPHRRYPLAKSRLDGDVVECGYHGLAFDSTGTCVRVPQQDSVPKNLKVKSFPLVEQWQWIWIWMGDPAAADPSKIPDVSWLRTEESGWASMVGGVETVNGRYVFLHDNILDLSHLSFLHNRNIGSKSIASSSVEFEMRQDHFALWRTVESHEFENAPLGKLMGVKGLVDRKMEQQFFAPSLHITGPAFSSALKGGISPGRPISEFRIFHGLTPADQHSTHYFWGTSRNFAIDDPEMSNRMRDFLIPVLQEDIDATEAIEKLIREEDRLVDEVSLLSDAPAIRGRRILREQIQAEHGSEA